MARFDFKLEALLTHREHVEKDAQRRMAKIQQEIQALVRQIQETRTRIVAEDRTLGTKELTGVLDMQYIAHEKRFVGNLHIKVMLSMQKLAGMEQSLNSARAELLAAARARKVIEKLKEKQFARWKLEQDRKESAAMDEIGTQLVIRNLAQQAHGQPGTNR